jgi:hypothetical protein
VNLLTGLKGEDPLDLLDADDEHESLNDPLLQDEGAADPATVVDTVTELFKSMPTYHKLLLSILESCIEKQRISVVIESIDEVLRNNFSVYKAARFCELLEQAGALLKVTEEGTQYADAKAQPILVEEDGLEYFKANEPPEAFWVTTEEGRRFLEADDPLERFRDNLENERVYHPIFTQILLLCSNEKGRSIEELGDALDDDPILQKPRMYARRFVEILERCDALTWDKGWKTTGIGQLGLEEIERYDKNG